MQKKRICCRSTFDGRCIRRPLAGRLGAWGLAVLVLLGVVCPAPAALAGEAESAAETEARKAAESWLALVDVGEYGKSWDEAADLFRSKITREQWIAALKQVRAPLGALGARKPWTAQYATELPGAPRGEYVVLQFNTRFAAKAGAVETVTPMRGADGRWRVSGYFIR